MLIGPKFRTALVYTPPAPAVPMRGSVAFEPMAAITKRVEPRAERPLQGAADQSSPAARGKRVSGYGLMGFDRRLRSLPLIRRLVE